MMGLRIDALEMKVIPLPLVPPFFSWNRLGGRCSLFCMSRSYLHETLVKKGTQRLAEETKE